MVANLMTNTPARDPFTNAVNSINGRITAAAGGPAVLSVQIGTLPAGALILGINTNVETALAGTTPAFNIGTTCGRHRHCRRHCADRRHGDHGAAGGTGQPAGGRHRRLGQHHRHADRRRCLRHRAVRQAGVVTMARLTWLGRRLSGGRKPSRKLHLEWRAVHRRRQGRGDRRVDDQQGPRQSVLRVEENGKGEEPVPGPFGPMPETWTNDEPRYPDNPPDYPPEDDPDRRGHDYPPEEREPNKKRRGRPPRIRENSDGDQ